MVLANKRVVKQLVLAGLASAMLALPQPGQAADDEAILAIIELLADKGLITSEEADKILDRHHTAPMRVKQPPVTVVVPEGHQELQLLTDTVVRDIKQDVSRQMKAELKKEISEEVKLDAYTASVPGWTKRIRFNGDLRLRYQGDFFPSDNVNYYSWDNFPNEEINRTVDRSRLRYRFRLGATAQINNQAEVGLRLATGNSSDPISTNDTLGDYFNKDSITLDQAYLKWTPIEETSTWTGLADFYGGRFVNPFVFTDLVWDKDLHFEGLASRLEFPFNTRFKALVNAGAFPLQEIDFESDDKWLYGGQLGFEYAPRATTTFTLAAAYYYYDNIKGVLNVGSADTGVNDYSVPQYHQTGNVVVNINRNITGEDHKYALAADYQLVNVTGRLRLGHFDPVFVTLDGDYVENIGFDREEVYLLRGSYVPEETTGWLAGLTVGTRKVKNLWDWQTSFTYKYLEADAVLDAFTDSDFHLGGTNAKGWIVGGQLGVGKNMWLKARWLSSDPITYTTIGSSTVKVSVDTLQFDINARF